MHSQVSGTLRTFFAMLTVVSLCASVHAQTSRTVRTAETSAKRREAVFTAMREIAKDPCNAQSKLPSLREPLAAAKRQNDESVDDLDEVMQRWVTRGCENSRKAMSSLELLLIAGYREYFDPCKYSPDNDYSVEQSLVKLDLQAGSFRIRRDERYRDACKDAFIIAALTREPVKAPAEASKPVADPPPSRRRRGTE